MEKFLPKKNGTFEVIPNLHSEMPDRAESVNLQLLSVESTHQKSKEIQ